MNRKDLLWACAAALSLATSIVPVFAAEGIDFQEMYNRLKTLITVFNMLAWIGVFLGWAMGIFTRILPIPSREVKQTGQSWTEWAGIGAFLLASGLTVINAILWILGSQLPEL